MQNKVEILFRRGGRMVFINGVEVGKICRIETPRKNGDTGLRVVLEFDADSVIERAPTDQEWSERRVLSREDLVERVMAKAAEMAAKDIQEQMQRGML